jgi:predicted dithiol-disulfide oxidoreductase (DUF899 family)
VNEEKIATLEEEIRLKQAELVALRKDHPAERIGNYTLQGESGKVQLLDLFGDQTDLMVIHNMGSTCPYCTLWADGLNGIVDHLQNRTGLALISPDPVEKQQGFALGRNWRFTMVSADGSTFIQDMGFWNEGWGGAMPGVSTFTRDTAGNITRVAKAVFGPGDAYCPAWHLFDLLADGVKDWQPGFSYE